MLSLLKDTRQNCQVSGRLHTGPGGSSPPLPPEVGPAMDAALPAPASRVPPLATHFYLLQPQTGDSTVSKRLPKGAVPLPQLLWQEESHASWRRNLITEGVIWPPTPLTRGPIVQPHKEEGRRTKHSPAPIHGRPPTLCTKGLFFCFWSLYRGEILHGILFSCPGPAFPAAWTMKTSVILRPMELHTVRPSHSSTSPLPPPSLCPTPLLFLAGSLILWWVLVPRKMSAFSKC